MIKDLLLLDDPSVVHLFREMNILAGYFIAPCFLIAIILEFLGNLEFEKPLKKILIVTIIFGSFQQIHIKSANLSLDVASKIIKKVSPNNLFMKRWNTSKVTTKNKLGWNFLQKFAIPNLNDLLATSFYLLAKVFLWLLKLIYSSVYHLTYIFSGISALLYFFGWTEGSLKGTILSSLWCIIMPFMVVAILSLVGNSINEKALRGDFALLHIDTILWLFGITLILLITPLITWSMVKGDGIASFGSKMGTLSVSKGMQALTLLPLLYNKPKRLLSRSSSKIGNFLENRKQNALTRKIGERMERNHPHYQKSKNLSNTPNLKTSENNRVELKNKGTGTPVAWRKMEKNYFKNPPSKAFDHTNALSTNQKVAKLKTPELRDKLSQSKNYSRSPNTTKASTQGHTPKTTRSSYAPKSISSSKPKPRTTTRPKLTSKITSKNRSKMRTTRSKR